RTRSGAGGKSAGLFEALHVLTRHVVVGDTVRPLAGVLQHALLEDRGLTVVGLEVPAVDVLVAYRVRLRIPLLVAYQLERLVTVDLAVELVRTERPRMQRVLRR